MAVAEGLEPSHGRINSAVPYQLGYATKNWLRRRDSNSYLLVYKTSALIQLNYAAILLVAVSGVEPPPLRL